MQTLALSAFRKDKNMFPIFLGKEYQMLDIKHLIGHTAFFLAFRICNLYGRL